MSASCFPRSPRTPAAHPAARRLCRATRSRWLRLVRNIRSDLYTGFAESGARLGVVAGVTLVILGFWLLTVRAWGLDIKGFTLGDALSACLGGIPVFDPERDLRFRFPATWMLMLLAITYVTLSYPYHDLMGFGTHVLVSCGSRWVWWFAKCAWVVLASLACCLIVGLVCTGFCAVVGLRFDLTLTSDAARTLYMWIDPGTSLALGAFAASAPCMVVALVLVQLAASLVLRPVLSFGTTAAVLLASAYCFSPLLPGNYLMAARTEGVIATGTSPLVGTLFALVLAVAGVMLGGVRFSHMDCMDKEFSA